MKNQELFDKTVNILVNSYQNGTLEHHNCYACAVGNLIASNMNMGFTNEPKRNCYTGMGTITWDTFIPFSKNLVSSICAFAFGEHTVVLGKEQQLQLEATGYTFEELVDIENAFEIPNINITDDEHMFRGLLSVVDCLMQIHEATVEQAEEAKALFVSA